ncbi:DUF4124 domain-containing protein [Parahaliea mediterranea]|uniref:DUF4124 domain-containing protein n=1 Tax=Parahaliea mediterranea TaxID=651086 RepID=UPI0013003EFE|nr:DUF4124 domain-containing protein [Parahaliea mediterranea]
MKTTIYGALGVATVALSLAAMQATAGTTYYRWQDERGNLVHSDRPPPQGVSYEVISTGGQFKRDVPADEGAVPREVNPSIDNRFDKKAVKTKEQIKKNPEVCDRARENLTTLETWDEVNVKDDQGDIRALSAEEKEQRKEEAKRQIALHCD